MSKYASLGSYLRDQRFDRVPMSFADIERIVGFKLPEKSEIHRAWWSNNPGNNVITKIWMDAGLRTEQVDIEARRLVFRRGRQWRLYHQGAKSRLEEYFEVDVAWLLGLPGSQGDVVAQLLPPDFASAEEWRNHLLDVMWLMFRREAFLPGADGRTFHQIALAEGREWEARVRESVADVVFRDVFPDLLRALRRA